MFIGVNKITLLAATPETPCYHVNKSLTIVYTIFNSMSVFNAIKRDPLEKQTLWDLNLSDSPGQLYLIQMYL